MMPLSINFWKLSASLSASPINHPHRFRLAYGSFSSWCGCLDPS
jgi:hypothetical protein